MQSTTKYKITLVILIVILLVLGQKYKVLRNEVNDYESALEEANNNIEEANSYIEDAQGYAWSSYEEMGQALENLSTVDTVFEPGGLRFLPSLPKLPKLPQIPKLPK